MTTAQKKGIQYALAILAGAAGVAFSTGYSRRELEGKEDTSAHVSDLTAVRDSVRSERAERIQQEQLRLIRDSAWKARMENRVTDIACDLNAKRRYCGGGTGQ
jgi:hypothetical protein